MSKLKYNQSIIGHTYGKLKILSLHSNINYRKKYLCLCECGRETIVLMSHLRTGHTESCGCIPKGNHKHGLSKSKLYKVYYSMIDRCYNESSSGYYKYGAKGIIISKKWLEDFNSFKEWAYLNGYQEGLTIDRIDGLKGYSAENCRWVSHNVQAINKPKISTNSSGYVGVSFNKSKGKWVGRVVHNNKRVETGSSSQLKEAVKMRKDYIMKNNLTNYIEAMQYE